MQESQHVEFKRKWKDEYLKWICGFANAHGGTLLIGVDDNGQAVGLHNAAKLLEELPNKVRDVLGILVEVNLIKRLQQKQFPVPLEALREAVLNAVVHKDYASFGTKFNSNGIARKPHKSKADL